jgi:hypothetical protein
MMTTQGGNPAFGFFDHFHTFQASTLEGPYAIQEVATAAAEQIPCTGNTATTGLGLLKLSIPGDTANDEAQVEWGRALGAPFKFNSNICFECRLAVSAITAAKWSWGVGLGEIGMGATDAFFDDASGGACALADKNFVGFLHLSAEGASVDGAYQADGVDKVDGAVNTNLDALHTLVADTFVKLGFRYQHHPRKLEWYVNGVLANEYSSTEASIGKTALDAAAFPDDVFMSPVMGVKDAAGDAAINIYVDWWGCAQAL